ncbi:MAG: alpha/beta fold hydrolase [Sneathiellales bacterium]|nr:alpha/beta fold hydrolase [Sneathiellales bacterium]
MKYDPPFQRTNGFPPVLILFGIMLFLPMILTDTYSRHILILVMIYAVIASNWDLSLGYGGIFNFAHMTFFAIGLYGYGLLAKVIGINPWLAILLAALVAVAFAALLSIPILKLEGVYVILVTIAASQLVLKLIVSQSDYTGGTSGMVLLPRLTVGDYKLNSDGRIGYYYAGLFLLGLSTLFLYKFNRSALGRAVKALRDNKYYAISRGVSEPRMRLVTLCASAFFPGLIGGFYGSYVRVASPDVFGLGFLTITLSILLVGGVSSTWGPILAAFLITVLAELLGDYGIWRDISIAALIILVIILYPGGLFAAVQELWNFADKNKTALIAWYRRQYKANARKELTGAEEKMIETRHGTVAVADTKTGAKSIVFIHGNSSCKEIFTHQFHYFSDHYRVVAIDLPGHGVSYNGRPEEDYSVQSYAQMVAEVVQKLDLVDPVIFGWSLGGYVALEYAAAGYPLTAVSISGTSPVSVFPDDMPKGYIPSPHMELAGKRFHSRYEKQKYALNTVGTDKPEAKMFRDAVWRTDGRAREYVFSKLKTIDWPRQTRLLQQGNIPFAMLNGPEDPFINHSYCQSLKYGNIWTGNVITIKGGGHAPFFMKPVQFNHQFRMFLKSLE